MPLVGLPVDCSLNSNATLIYMSEMVGKRYYDWKCFTTCIPAREERGEYSSSKKERRAPFTEEVISGLNGTNERSMTINNSAFKREQSHHVPRTDILHLMLKDHNQNITRRTAENTVHIPNNGQHQPGHTIYTSSSIIKSSAEVTSRKIYYLSHTAPSLARWPSRGVFKQQ